MWNNNTLSWDEKHTSAITIAAEDAIAKVMELSTSTTYVGDDGTIVKLGVGDSISLMRGSDDRRCNGFKAGDNDWCQKMGSIGGMRV